MNNVNKTLYIPLYGKAYVSWKNVIMQDKRAEEIWEQEGFALKGKSASKWLAYYMAMRAAVYDEWVKQQLENNPDCVVLHVGCGMDSRVERINAKDTMWYDMDFPEVIGERRKYYTETEHYRMVAADMRSGEWKKYIAGKQNVIVLMEGVSMYFKPEELTELLSAFVQHFAAVHLLMDCYSVRAAKLSKYKNPINDVGVTEVYGYDEPQVLARASGLVFEKAHCMTPQKYIDELQGMEKSIFKHLYAGKIAEATYKMYEFRKENHRS